MAKRETIKGVDRIEGMTDWPLVDDNECER